jgi:perosamine synthetase
VRTCPWIVPQKTPAGYVNAYWNYAARIDRDDVAWVDFLRKFNELGGDGFYASYQPAHLEPVFANLNRDVDEHPERYPQWAGRQPRYERGLCPVWESIQPRIIMLKTNYFDLDLAERQAEVLGRTIRHFD